MAGALYRREGGKTPVVADINTYLFHVKNLGNEDIFSWPMGMLHRQRLKLIGKYADMLLPVSPTVQRIYSEHGISKSKMMMIPDGFDLNELRKNKIKRTDRSFNILYVGRLELTKGVDITIKALRHLSIPVKFHVAGEGPQMHKLKELAKHLGLSDKVIFHGFVDFKKMCELYSNSDLFVHAPRWEEPFGRAIVEAMAFGLPVVAANIGAPPWVANSACLTFNPEKEKDLADKIKKIYEDKKLRKRLSSSALKRAKYFDVKNTVSQFIEVYKKVVGHKQYTL